MSNVCNCSRKVLCPVLSKHQKKHEEYNGVASLTGSAIAHLAMDSQEVKVEQVHAQKDYEAFTAESAESQTDEVKG